MDTLLLDVVDYHDDAHWQWRLSDREGTLLAAKRVALDTTSVEYEAFSESISTGDLGDWIAKRVLGNVATVIAERSKNEPLVVRLRLGAKSRALLGRPFELARVGGKPLALHDVSLVFETAPKPDNPDTGPRRRLRFLAVFSLPVDERAIAVRRERHQLTELIHRMATAIDLRVVQYGATRERLRTLLSDPEGWDIVHISGHGLPGGLLLERPDGSRDLIGTRQLTELLRLARPRLRLVTLSSCQSAAKHAARLAEDVAVLAMRFPVDDEFAIDLTTGVYESLLGYGEPLPRALQRAIKTSAQGRPALCAATPALFGSSATSLRFPCAPGHNHQQTATPPAPQRFVGRTAVIMRAAEALAEDSGRSGVVFLGAAGSGKTHCALELAHTQAFDHYLFHSVPPNPVNAFATMRADLDRQLPGFRELNAVVVIDNLDPLIDEGDERCAPFIAALTSEDVKCKCVFTARSRHSALLGPRILELPLHGLSPTEAILLAKQLPNLSPLMDGELVRRALSLAQGHPGLIELMNADPARLDDYLQVLRDWTLTTVSRLPIGDATAFQVVACLEPDDRRADVLEDAWPDIWRELGRPEDPPAFAQAAEGAAAHGLMRSDYQIQPYVADSVRDALSPGIRNAVDAVLARRSSGRQAIPYLLRVHDWAGAAAAIEEVLDRDSSPATVASLLPALTRVVDACPDELDYACLLLRAQTRAHPRAPDAELIRRGDELFRRGGLRVTGELVELALRTGDLAQAQAFHERRPVAADRLRILSHQGRDAEVLEQAAKELDEQHWRDREAIMRWASVAGSRLGDPTAALEWNAKRVRSLLQRGASPYELAMVRLEDYSDLLAIGSLDAARSLVMECQAIFKNDPAMRGPTLLALAHIEERSGRLSHAIRLGTEALSWCYASGDLKEIARAHGNIAADLAATATRRDAALAHRLAAAVIGAHLQSPALKTHLTGLAADLAPPYGEPPELPAAFADLCARVDQPLETLGLDGDGLLAEVISAARTTQMVRLEDQGLSRIWSIIGEYATPGGQPGQGLKTLSQWTAVQRSIWHALSGASEDRRPRGPGPADAATLDAVAALFRGEVDLNAPLFTRMDELVEALSAEVPESFRRIWAELGDDGMAVEATVREITQEPDDAIAFASVLLRLLTAQRAGAILPEPTAVLATGDTMADQILGYTTTVLQHGRDNAEAALIRSEYAPLIAATVAAARGDPVHSAGLDAMLADMAADPDWCPLSRALQDIVDGRRDSQVIEPPDSVIVKAVLDTLEGRDAAES